MNKRSIRREVLDRRSLIPENEVCRLSSRIVSAIASLQIFEKSHSVAIYSPFRNEADITALICAEKVFFFPKIVEGSKKLDFYKTTSLCELKPGSYGILEPEISAEKSDIDKIDLFLVPGVAFSITGERLGYGGGYYDTTLKFASEDAFKIGIAYDDQITDCGFSDEHDIKMDMVVTEKNVYVSNHLT